MPYAIAAVAVALVWWFAAVTLAHAGTMGLPLDDGYIYMTYAKQFGRAEPFTYYSGGGYSAGSTSVLWPMLLAPFWTLGARGHALVWVSFGLCGALYTATCVGCYRLVRTIAGIPAGIAAAAIVLMIGPFAWTALSGMEVAFASALLVATLILLVDASDGPPSKLLGACLAATSLSRPEAMLLVGAICGVSVLVRLRRRDWRAAAWWAAPLAAPIAWLVANKVFAGNFMPNTGVAKSYFYMPGFDWTFWWDATTSQTGKMLKALFVDGNGPFTTAARLVGIAWLVGAVRVLAWARRNKRWLAGVTLVIAPIAMTLAVNASSGSWELHEFRYIAPAFPLIAMTAAVGLAPMTGERSITWTWTGALAVVMLALGIDAFTPMRDLVDLYAQDVVDLNSQVVTLGVYIHDHLPDAHVMYHDAGAIAYYGDRPVYDMLGLVTNHQAAVANNGPGSRFEFLEDMAPEDRPSHFAYYPGWMGQDEMYGDVVLHTPRPRERFGKLRSLIGGDDMELFVATFDRVHTAERPITPHAGWAMVDRVDIADLVSERDHDWVGNLGRRKVGDPTAHWSVFAKQVGTDGLLLDGGRTIRGGERFTVAIDPDKPVRLLLRTGGAHDYPYNEKIERPVDVTVNGQHTTIPTPTGTFIEMPIDLPAQHASRLEVVVEASAPYRAFHWFVLQPE